MTLQHLSVDVPAIGDPEVSWTSPAAGLWVASRRVGSVGTDQHGAEYAGMVELIDGAYHARSARGRALGSFEDLASARTVLGAAADESRVAPRGVRMMLGGMIGAGIAGVFLLALELIR